MKNLLELILKAAGVKFAAKISICANIRQTEFKRVPNAEFCKREIPSHQEWGMQPLMAGVFTSVGFSKYQLSVESW